MNSRLEALLKKKETKDVSEVLYDKLDEWPEAVYKGLADTLNVDVTLLDFLSRGSMEDPRYYVVYSEYPLTKDGSIFYANVSSAWIIDQLGRAADEYLFPCRGRFEERESANGMTYYVLK